MEVHHHAHTSRKKWTHYLWEFLMLFLAVFCGFLAENQREHLVEHQREKQYIKSLLQDLKQDTIALSQNIKSREQRRICADSLIYELSSSVSKEAQNSIYYYAANLSSLQLFNYSNSTIQQLKNSGLMRLIRKPDVVNSINSYDLLVTRHKVREDVELDITVEYQKAISFVLDAITVKTMGDSLINNAFRPTKQNSLIRPVYRYLVTNDPDKINLVKGLAAQLYNRNLSNYFSVIRFRKEATNIIELIKKEYHLE
ncbi:MAG TPA: hypothetical protein VJ765_17735 [Chitinophagaceae bacterium]|nr:hypothetical protein [Chitinophagaceae bacterium]